MSHASSLPLQETVRLQPAAVDMLDELSRAVSCRVKVRAAQDRGGEPIGDDDVRRAWAEVVQAEGRNFSLSVYSLASTACDASGVSIRNGALGLICRARRGLAIKARKATEEIVRARGRSLISCLDIVCGWHRVIEGPGVDLEMPSLIGLLESEARLER